MTVSNIALDPESGRPYFLEGADDATLVEDPSGRGAYFLRGSVDVEVDHNTVERSIDGGQSWELVMDGLPINGTLTDPECLSYGTTLYRVTAVSALPSSSVSEIEELNANSLDIWLNGGDGFAVAAPISCEPGLTVKPGLVEKDVYYFAGQDTGTSVSGKARQRIYSLKGTIHEDDGDGTDVRQILEEVMPFLPDPFLVRDFAGHRIYASVSDLQVEWEAWRTYSVSFEAEVIHRGDS